ncbi:MAG: DUF488 family protein [Candidatus Thermoplasmatota archaeon]|nr:DUF488 family protein [Candidatus Thermoplasmatota archaeon]
MTLKLKRIYEPYSKDDGFRVLVERLWPRGMSKEKAHVELWLRNIGPSNELRKWFNHDTNKWEEFQKRYLHELENNIALDKLKSIVSMQRNVTLVFSSQNEENNNAVVLYNLLAKQKDKKS